MSHPNDTAPGRPLADRLRAALHAARGDLAVRAHLEEIAADPERIAPIVNELGPRHALVRELLAITRRGESPSSERAA